MYISEYLIGDVIVRITPINGKPIHRYKVLGHGTIPYVRRFVSRYIQVMYVEDVETNDLMVVDDLDIGHYVLLSRS